VTNNAAEHPAAGELSSSTGRSPGYENVPPGQSGDLPAMTALFEESYGSDLAILGARAGQVSRCKRNTTEAINAVMYCC